MATTRTVITIHPSVHLLTSVAVTMTSILQPPIILFGNYRSGTTLAQNLIGLHPSVVTWYEPRTLWLYADPRRPHDEFDDRDVTERVARYIRARFKRYQTAHGGRRIVENTPSNVLRVPYVSAIFPEATYLYITRNPFSCISSMELQWQGRKKWRGLLRTLKTTPATQILYYTRDFFNYFVMRRLTKQEYMSFYGPRYKGFEMDLKEFDRLVLIARQWAICNRKAREDLQRLGEGRLRRIYEHCGLDLTDEILNKAREMIDPTRQEKWKRLDTERLKAVIPHIRDEMEACGYEVPPALK